LDFRFWILDWEEQTETEIETEQNHEEKNQ